MTNLTRQNKIRDFVRMNQRPYTTTLTISLLVSNSIKTIRNCMESLQPLLSQVSSELIIVDTVGPENSDGSLTIAEKYADKVIHFKWCDDFAAARNAGLKEAHGKWFMFIDDDEWFDDVSELVTFFNDDNEQQKYFSLAYNIHNYYDATGTSYQFTKYNRCSRLWKNSEFVGKVHEFLNPTFSPTKYVANTFVHHYGYAKEVGNAKTKRNGKLLKQLVTDNPTDMHAWSQLVANYDRSTAKNRQKIIYFAELALNNFKKISVKNDNDQVFAAAVLGYWLEAVSLEKDWTQVIKLAKKYLPSMYLQSYNLCMIDSLIFSAFIQLNNKSNAVVIFKEYLANFNIIQNNEQLLLRQYTPFLPHTVSYAKLAKMSSIVLSFLIENKSWKKITLLIRQLPISSNVKGFSRVILDVCKASFNSRDSTILQTMWNKLTVDDKQLLELAKLINSYKNSLIFTDKKKLIKLLDETNIDHPYFQLQKAKLITDQELQKQTITKLMSEIDTFTSPYEDLFILAISHHINPQKLISPLSNHELMNLVNNTNRYFIEKIQSIPSFLTKIEESWPSCPQRSLLLMAMRENYLFSNQIVLPDIYREIGNYIKDSLNFAHTLYQNECFQPEPSNLLPEKYKFVFYLDHAFKAKNKKDTANFFKNLKIALECAPQANSLIKRLISNFTIKQQKSTQEQQEFQQLADNIKIKIRTLIAGKQQQAALSLLKTLADIIPNDPEVTKLLQQVDK